MADFPVHSPATAPERALPALDVARRTFGFLPNLIGVLSEAPAAAAGYLALAFQFESASFSAAERQVVLLAASAENRCDYCLGAHGALAAGNGLAPEEVERLRAGERLEDCRLDALARFTRALVGERGRLEPAAVESFLSAGFDRAQVLEVVLGVALKTLSNYANHLAATPLDPAFAALSGPAARPAPAVN